MTLPRWRIWFMATRPWSLTISVVPIVLASVLAWQDGGFSPLYAILMLLTSILTHIGCNLTNDYFDHHSGVDAVQLEGQGRMLQEGHLSEHDLRNGMIVSFALALVFGAPIIAELGWWGVVFALVGAGVAFLYTGGPWPLAYNRMGEIGVFVAMGLVMVGGAYYVHTGTFTWPAAIIATCVGLYASAILHANNMRDIHVDKMHRKHTLANTFGWTFGVWEYGASIVAPLALTLGIIVFEPSYWPLIVVLLVIPATLAAWTMMRTTPEGELTGAIVGFTTKLHMRYGLLVTLGLLIKGVIDL
ncbi:MAG TPA: 1,4-dihydroxy-2-naphthoate octaprenyltransferase [Thermomicrobiales bacterium]|jgi:1,4-dihydroxy-2-naphthoate octaprenyltransferase|nr:1,4-dihydroxy-2-naphthoate octaprenyltransferase [Thermomicrobiales bacterium]